MDPELLQDETAPVDEVDPPAEEAAEAEAAPVEEPMLPPMESETNAAIEKINEKRDPTAAEALRHLVQAVMAAVVETDRIYRVSQYVVWMGVIVEADGIFRLQIVDKDTGVDSEQVINDVLAQMNDACYGKERRHVQLLPAGTILNADNNTPYGSDAAPAEAVAGTPDEDGAADG